MVLQVLAATCYDLDGTNTGPAIGTAGSHSACCNAENADACLSTGLCLNSLSRQQNHMLWATACKDPTSQDPSCPQFCHGRHDANIVTTEECCNQASQLSQPIDTVVAQLQSGLGAIPLATAAATFISSFPPSSSASSSSSREVSETIPAEVIAGLVVKSVILAATLAGTENKADGTLSQAYAYGSPVESEPPKRSDIHFPRMGYPELSGEPIGIELPSDRRTSRNPSSSRSTSA
ncbi:hypothetical protein GGR53DRAFT_523762 [Hypoxylon sp. FL1150]|nr:hypothetical protein GGR53DRAFT_523762 [Hypoxylon sp. FL1150]